MPTVVEVTEPLRSIYCTVPRAGPGVCAVCHSQPGAGFNDCYSCHAAISQVSYPLRVIVPISLMSKDGQLYFELRHYKDAPPSATTQRFQRNVAAIIGRFLDDHGACIAAAAGRGWDAITIVPSTRNRVGAHPLADAVRLLIPTGESLVDTLRANPSWTGGDREAADERFEVITEVTGRSILIVDDTMTTGARIQSAASALSLAGATVVAAVPVGRLVNPEHSPDVWRAAAVQTYDFDVCCVERGGPPAPTW